jgi:UDP-2-acetamido-3-amino-2,3-dideoxy-glucuronate N-acetyltransferase
MSVTKHQTAEVSEKALIGDGTRIWHYVQIRENAKIGKNCILGKNVYVDFDVKIGNNVKIQNNSSVYHGVTIEDGVFIGPHVCLTNDKFPRAITPEGDLKTGDDWEVGKTLIKKGASIGACTVILPGVTIGEYALVGSGSVVTKDVPQHGLIYGNPARLTGFVCICGKKLEKSGKKNEKVILKCPTCGKEIVLQESVYDSAKR